MCFFNDTYCCKYTRVAYPFIGFVSGGLLHVVIDDVYRYYFKKTYPKNMTLERLHNFSAYLGLTLGLSVLYRGKPLLMK